MTLRRTPDLRIDRRNAERVLVEADNLRPAATGEHVSVTSSPPNGAVVLTVYVGMRGGALYLDPDLARTMGTALLAAARVVERSRA